MDIEAETAFSGVLERDAGGFILRQDGGTNWPLLLQRVPVDLVAKRVVVTGWTEEGILHARAIRSD